MSRSFWPANASMSSGIVIVLALDLRLNRFRIVMMPATGSRLNLQTVVPIMVCQCALRLRGSLTFRVRNELASAPSCFGCCRSPVPLSWLGTPSVPAACKVGTSLLTPVVLTCVFWDWCFVGNVPKSTLADPASCSCGFDVFSDPVVAGSADCEEISPINEEFSQFSPCVMDVICFAVSACLAVRMIPFEDPRYLAIFYFQFRCPGRFRFWFEHLQP